MFKLTSCRVKESLLSQLSLNQFSAKWFGETVSAVLAYLCLYKTVYVSRLLTCAVSNSIFLITLIIFEIKIYLSHTVLLDMGIRLKEQRKALLFLFLKILDEGYERKAN